MIELGFFFCYFVFLKVVVRIFGLKSLWGMVRGNLGCGLPCRLGQALCLNVGLRPVLANNYTSEVLPIGRKVG